MKKEIEEVFEDTTESLELLTPEMAYLILSHLVDQQAHKQLLLMLPTHKTSLDDVNVIVHTLEGQDESPIYLFLESLSDSDLERVVSDRKPSRLN